MNLVKRYYEVVALIAVAALVFMASTAQAYTISQAGRAADAKEKSTCGASWNWTCQATEWPTCRASGQNRYGYPQWWCQGRYHEAEIVPLFDIRDCDFYVGIGPSGGLYDVQSNCY